MLADFVSKRGGGLLMLGGRRSFAEGGWAGTPVAEVLPVDARQPTAAGQTRRTSRSSRCSRRAPALIYPVTQIADTEEGVGERSGTSMPAVSAVNPIHAREARRDGRC